MEFKKVFKILIISVCAAFFLASVVFSGYFLTIYADFLSNRNSIFSKIEDFSKSLGKNRETGITLGLDDSNEENAPPTIFYDRNKKIIAKYATNKHKLIPLNQIPYFLTKGFIIIEDKAFYKHNGINYVRFFSAFIKNIFTLGKSPGGSTISQQLAKILFTRQERSLKRKIYEIFCVFELEKRFNKNEILQIYLNSIYLGHGIYGIENAAGFYFGKSANRLNVIEASLLVGMNRSPERYSPIKNRENARKVQKIVLNQLEKNKLVKGDGKEDNIEKFWKKFDATGNLGTQSFWKTDENNSGYITEYVRQILETEFSYDKITGEGLIVETTIDLQKQTLAEKIVRERLKYIKEDIEKNALKLKLSGYEKEKLERLEGALVSLDYKSGEILVLVGGSGYSFANQFNRAVYAYRPIGSSVKPFVYAMALNDGKIGDASINPFSKFKDDIFTYDLDGKKYTPRNYHSNHKYGKMVTIYDALKTSLNTVAVEVFSKMDKKEVVNFIQSASFLSDENAQKRIPETLSLALGTCDLSPLELATAYSVFPRLGKRVYPIIIKKIYDYRGNVYYDYERENNPFFNNLYPKESRDESEILKPQISYEIVQMLRSVFEKGGTAYWAANFTGFWGIGYGKSGTTQNFKDGWFAGFDNSEVVTSWVGFDTNESLLIASEGNATLIWCDYMKQFSNSIVDEITPPEGMRLIRICSDTGLAATKKCPNKKDFYFWTEKPVPEKCYIHDSELILDF
ncbi:MAG TPA: transglycosylase domain-containing protein [Spirochaetota bacterium]|nr:transglycosylase domain-containing protein [Spirochaetota bacterium]